MPDDLTEGLIIAGATLGGAALSYIGYKLWEHGFFGRRREYLDLQHAQYNAEPLLQSITRFSLTFATASEIYQQQHHEVDQLIAQQKIPLTEEQRKLLTKWKDIAAALFQHCQNKPEISETVSTQHEADIEVKTLDQYTITLNQLLGTCSEDYQVLLAELEPKKVSTLTM